MATPRKKKVTASTNTLNISHMFTGIRIVLEDDKIGKFVIEREGEEDNWDSAWDTSVNSDYYALQNTCDDGLTHILTCSDEVFNYQVEAFLALRAKVKELTKK